MERELIDAGLARHRALDTNDVEESCAALGRDICPHSLQSMATAHVRTVHDRLILPSSTLNRVHYGVQVRIENAKVVNSYLVILPLEGRSTLRFGKRSFPLSTAAGVIVGPGARFEIDGDANANLLIWRVSAGSVHRAAQSMGSSLIRTRQITATIGLKEGPGSGFLRTLQFLLAETARGDGLAASLLLMKRSEELLILAMLESWLPEFGAHARQEILPACVKRVERFIDEHLEEEIVPEDLAVIAVVSDRTLYRTFRHFRGYSPMEYVRIARLEKVRNDLLNASRADTVTAIQMRWGVTQPGRFSAQYREAYDELPSDTFRIARRLK